MTTYLGKSCSFCLPRVPFVNCRQFMYLVISLLVLRTGYGIWLYQFLIIAYLFYFAPSANKTLVMTVEYHMDRVKRIWYLSHMRAAKVQASLRIRAVSPEPSLLAHTSSESRGTFRQKTRSLAPLNGWACAVKICHDRQTDRHNFNLFVELTTYKEFQHLNKWMLA